jgi:hypothetical protein
VIASARVESSVCWIYGWTRRLTVPAGACTHACIAARLRVIPWKLAYRMLYCSAVQSSVDEFRSQDFGLKLNWEAPMGSDLVYSTPEWNADKTRVDKVRY